MKTAIVVAPNRRTVARSIALLVATLPLVALAGTPIDKRTTADPAGTVEISNTAGSVLVTGWDRNEVEVTGELGKGTERLEFTKSDKITRIKVVLPNRSSNVDDTDLVVKVPAGSQVSINTVSADIGVQAVRGTQRLQSVSGDLQHRDQRRRPGMPHRQRRRDHRRLRQEGASVDHDRERRRQRHPACWRGEWQHRKRRLHARRRRNQQVAPAIDQRQPDIAGLAGAGRARRHRKHQRGRAAGPGRRDRRGLRRFELQRRDPTLLRAQAGAHRRIRPGQGMAPPGSQRQRPRAHQDAERRRRRVPEIAARGYARSAD